MIGLGYIGLPTAAMFASKEKKVIGVDVNQHTVDTINSGKIHIVEPQLDLLVKKAVDGGFLRATTSPEPADVFLIAVPTPFLPEDTEGAIPQPDLSYIRSATEAIARVLKKGDLVILESTSPVGTTEIIADWLAGFRPDLTFPQIQGVESDIRIAHCPERVLPGHVIRELVDNDRVIGGMTKRCSEAATQLYQIFLEGECLITNARTAEMAKLTENASRDVSIAFANELSVICEKIDVDVWELIQIANRHPRVNILYPGPGVGGHCIAVDPWFIVSRTPEQAQLILAARRVNDAKPAWVIERVKVSIAEFLQDNLEKKISDVTIACYGLAFKADIDDLRESPALKIAQELTRMHSGTTLSVEPNISDLPANVKGIKLVSYDDAILAANIHVLLVDHRLFKENKIVTKFMVDCKGIWKS